MNNPNIDRCYSLNRKKSFALIHVAIFAVFLLLLISRNTTKDNIKSHNSSMSAVVTENVTSRDKFLRTPVNNWNNFSIPNKVVKVSHTKVAESFKVIQKNSMFEANCPLYVSSDPATSDGCLHQPKTSSLFKPNSCSLSNIGYQSLEQFNACQLNFKDLRSRNYWLMGNSVTRHYAFALRDLLQETSTDTHMDRHMEKSSCQGVLGTSSCDMDVYFNDEKYSKITFGWKNYIGTTPSVDDTTRDICYSLGLGAVEKIKECYDKLFQGATSHDVLLVGSISTNVSAFIGNGGNSWKGFEISGPQFAQASKATHHADNIQLLLASFPGSVIWHSFPHVVMAHHNGANPGDLNRCFTVINNHVKCASGSFDRAMFLDLSIAQMAHEDLYADFIHHPGALSKFVVNAMLSELG
mmetsp:Transcript_3186/g.3948  ORF Transcript_3186/g.3948 Transcript_3186/m.3948 type:complete len:409 (+) Transcript_3186:54-1280(+)